MECAGGRVGRAIGLCLISLQRSRTRERGPHELGQRPTLPQGLRILTRGKAPAFRGLRKPTCRTPGRATSVEGRRGVKRRRSQPGVEGSERAGKTQEALRMEQVALGDAVDRTGP